MAELEAPLIAPKRTSRVTKRWSMHVKDGEGMQVVCAGQAASSGHAKAMVTSEMAEQSKAAAGLHKRASMVAQALVGGHEETPDDEEGLQSNGEAMVNLLNNCLGSGMLGIGFAISEAGIWCALFFMVFAVMINKYTLLLNLKSCQIMNADPATTEIGEKTMGKPGKLLMVCMFTCLGFFCMVSYISAGADALLGLVELFVAANQMPSKPQVCVVAWVVLMLPPTFIRSLKGVAVMSFVAFLGGLVMLVCCLILCAQNLAVNGLPTPDQLDWSPPTMAGLMTAVPVLCLCFSIQAGGGVVLATMQDRSQKNIEKVCNGAYLAVYVMDMLLGFGAYFTFRQEVKGDLIENLPNSFLSTIARVCCLDLVVLSYMIMCIPCKVSVIDLLFGKNEALQESTSAQFYGVTMVLNILALIMSITVTDLSLILGLNGAICTNFNAFILPALFYVIARSRPEDGETEKVSVMSPRNLPFLVIFIFGVFMLCLGSYQIFHG